MSDNSLKQEIDLKTEVKSLIEDNYTNDNTFNSNDIRYLLKKEKSKEISAHSAGRLLFDLKDDGFLKEYSGTGRRLRYQMT